MNDKMYMAVYVDHGETCDGHARMLGVYDNRENAVRDVRADMDARIRNIGDGASVYSDKFEVWAKGEEGVNGCVWDVIEFGTLSTND